MINSYNPYKVFYIEVWRKHPLYENYEASNFGNIRSLNYNKTDKTKELKQRLRNGYLCITISVDGKRKDISSHRFIFECWNGLIEEGLEIDHIDTIKTNNSLSNLRLGTTSENINNPITITKKSKAFVNYPKFSKKVLQFSLKGDFIKEFVSTKEIERELGFDNSHIGKCCNGKLKTAYGFLWRYAE